MKRQLQSIKLALFALALGVHGVASAQSSGMVNIPAGWYVRGDSRDGNIAANAPVNQVYVNSFQMDANLVSLTLWQTVYQYATAKGYTFTDAGTGFGASHPVQAVSWYDAVKWCNARSESAGLTPCYYTDASLTSVYRSGTVGLKTNYVNWAANGYRLPTEAEWEKAARGILVTNRFPLGNTINDKQACYKSSADLLAYDLGPAGQTPTMTTAVGSFPPNGYGLYDMAGNVEEWCWDYYTNKYYGGVNTNNPLGPNSSSTRVARGGDWQDFANYATCALRNFLTPTFTRNFVGFRCVQAASSLATPSVSVNVGTYVYDGAPQGPDASDVNTGGSTGAFTLSYAGTGGTSYGPSSIEPTAAGSYTVTATVAADSTYSQASTSPTAFTIGKATPSVSVSVGTYVYNGSPQGPGVAAVSKGGSSGALTLSYAGTGNTSYGPSSTEPTALGSYTVTATVAADSNYVQGSSGAIAFAIITVVAGDVDPSALASLLGTGKITLTELQAVLADYDHSTGTNIVNYNALQSLIQADTITTNDLLLFIDDYIANFNPSVNPNVTVAKVALADLSGTSSNVVTQSGVNTVLASYWANNPPCITNIGFANPTNFVFALTNFTFRVQASTNLTTWQDVGPACFQFTDTNAVVHRTSFYRLVTQTNQ